MSVNVYPGTLDGYKFVSAGTATPLPSSWLITVTTVLLLSRYLARILDLATLLLAVKRYADKDADTDTASVAPPEHDAQFTVKIDGAVDATAVVTNKDTDTTIVTMLSLRDAEGFTKTTTAMATFTGRVSGCRDGDAVGVGRADVQAERE